MVFQEPMTSLNPVFTIGNQIAETLRIHGRATRADARRTRSSCSRGRHPRAGAARARLPAPALGRHAAARDDRDGARLRPGAPDRRRADDGARRHDPGADPRPAARAAAAAAAWRSCSSRTTSASSPRWPTASPSCTRAGSSRRRPVRRLFARPQHPYTRGLLASMPGGAPGPRLRGDPGHGARRSAQLPPGCAFAPRCPDRFEPCCVHRHRPGPTDGSAAGQCGQCYLHAVPRRQRRTPR